MNNIASIFSRNNKIAGGYILFSVVLVALGQIIAIGWSMVFNTTTIPLIETTVRLITGSVIIYALGLLYYNIAYYIEKRYTKEEKVRKWHDTLNMHFTKLRDDPENCRLSIHFPLFILPSLPNFLLFLNIIADVSIFP